MSAVYVPLTGPEKTPFDPVHKLTSDTLSALDMLLLKSTGSFPSCGLANATYKLGPLVKPVSIAPVVSVLNVTREPSFLIWNLNSG